jgi:AcrR family transcriptional regulator
VCDAARHVIVRKGLERTTLRDIAREGGFTTGVVTHHFPDKQAVVVGAFAAASEEWLADVRAQLVAAGPARAQLEALVRVGLPDDPRRRAEWRLWAEMWTYAGRDAAFARQLVETDARWEAEIRGVLERAAAEGLLVGVDPAAEATLLARLVDGLGLRAWLSGRWDDARRRLAAHLARLAADPTLGARLRGAADDPGGDP